MPYNGIKSMSYGSIACFCFMCDYDFAYRDPDTQSGLI